MNRKETQGVLALLRAAYPNFYKDMPKQDLLAVVNLWQMQFAEMDVNLVLAAVNALISSRVEGYPPTIGAVKEKAAGLVLASQLPETEAWALVSRAARNGAYGAEKEFAKLPLLVQSAVGNAQQLRAWAVMETQEVETVVASNFMRTYRQLAARQKEQELLPGSVKNSLPGLQGLPAGEEGVKGLSAGTVVRRFGA